MSPAVLFREVQQFRQWWLWLLIAPGLIVIWYRVFRHLNFGSNPPPNGLQLFFWMVAGVGLPLLLCSIRLVTEVRNDGLYLRFYPFHWSFLRFPVDSIKHSEARTYSPIGEYGGWGIRYGWNGKAYNVSGNQGIQVQLINGKRILVGSQRPREFLAALRSLGTPA